MSQLAPALDSSPPQLCASSLRGNPFSATEQHLRPPRLSSHTPAPFYWLIVWLQGQTAHNGVQFTPIVILYFHRGGPPVTVPKKPFSQKPSQGTEGKRTLRLLRWRFNVAIWSFAVFYCEKASGGHVSPSLQVSPCSQLVIYSGLF